MIDRLSHSLLIATLVVGCATSSPQTDSPLEGHSPEQAGPAAEHAWLMQLVGTWDVTNEADMGPDAPPMEMKATETVRAIGDLWIHTELVGETEGFSVTGAMTVGFDPESGRFLGTWIDSSQPRMWIYDGELDEDGTTLSLYSEGPDFQDPTITRLYRDATTVLAPGHRRFSSSVQNDDGSWTVFMSGEARRISD
jgi:hypothetical protein